MKNFNEPLVYIVVLHWKNYEATHNALTSLERISYPNYRVLVIDNCSDDGSVEKLQAEFPELRFILNPANLGFARGCNVGIRAGLEDPACAYLMLLNNDATIAKRSLDYGVRFAESDKHIGVVGGKILMSENSKTIWYAGGHINLWLGRATVRGFGEQDVGQFDSACQTGFATGAMMLVKRKVFETVGLLPEDYFFGTEEWDFSMRVKRAHLKLFYVPEFLGYHGGDGSHWNYDPKFVYNSYRNKLIFQQRYFPRLLFPLWKALFAFYGKHHARNARQDLIAGKKFPVSQPVELDDLDFALSSALNDHGQNRLSEDALLAFESAVRSRRTAL